VVPGPATSAPPLSCRVEVVNPITQSDRLPLGTPYSLRVTGSSSFPSGAVVLLRRPTPGQEQRPRVAWVKAIGAGSSGQAVEVGSFSMEAGTGETTADPIRHQEPPGATFDLELRPADRPAVTCGTLFGY